MTSGVVLIADPEAEARAQCELALARAGYSVVSVADGARALRVATRIVPDQLLTEILLPNLDGFHLAERLHRQVRTRNIGIIAVTNYNGDDLKQRATRSGIDRVLPKTASMHEIVRAVRSAVRHSRSVVSQSADLRSDVDVEIARGRNLRERAEDVIAESRVLAGEIAHALGAEAVEEHELLREADGARAVMIVDPLRGEQLFDALFTRFGDRGLLHYKRGEAYRAMGRRKLAHLEFLAAAERCPEGLWRDRARVSAMRTRSHHEKTREE